MGCLGAFVVVSIIFAMAGFGYTELVATKEHGDSPIFPLLLLVIPLLVAGAIVAKIVSRLLLRGRATRGAEALTTIAVAAIIGATLLVQVDATVVVRRPNAALTAALAPACARQAVPGASAMSSSGNHLVVLDVTGREHGWTGFPPVTWRPPDLGDAELVACVGPETSSVIQVCAYSNGPSITRYEAKRAVTVAEAVTGNIVTTFTVTQKPRTCAASEKKDVTELRATVGWPIVEQHLKALVDRGVFVDPDGGGSGSGEPTARPEGTAAPTAPPLRTASPYRTASPSRTASPETTPKPTAKSSATATTASMELRKAIAAGLITAKGTGDGLQRLDLRVTSKSAEPLRVLVAIGTMFDPSASATQSMVVLRATSVDLEPKGSATVRLDVACAEMRDDQPGSDDSFRVRATQASTAVMKLLRASDFATESFRVQQFAIWTLIHNPAAGGYAGLGSTFSFYGSGPSKDELTSIKSLLTSAGIDPADYRAFK